MLLLVYFRFAYVYERSTWQAEEKKRNFPGAFFFRGYFTGSSAPGVVVSSMTVINIINDFGHQGPREKRREEQVEEEEEEESAKRPVFMEPPFVYDVGPTELG